MSEEKEMKRLKRQAKKERRKAEAIVKTRMETVRTFCSAGAFCMSILSLLRVYHVI